MKKGDTGRRNFLKEAIASGIFISSLPYHGYANIYNTSSKIKLGLVTYLWAKDWTNAEIIKNCEISGIQGVELRSTHAHGVEINLSKNQRKEVKKMYKNSNVELVGLGSAEEFDQKDMGMVRQAIENTKAFIKLSHDVGGSGVKVRPNHLHEDVPHEQTIEQIGKALNEVAAFGADYGQEIRVEVHGRGTQYPEVMRKIMDGADHKNAKVCWNCNKEDLEGKGFDHNFNLLKNKFGKTFHIRELDSTDYPYPKMVRSLVEMDYKGWLLLECHTHPENTIMAMTEQKRIFDTMIKKYS